MAENAQPGRGEPGAGAEGVAPGPDGAAPGPGVPPPASIPLPADATEEELVFDVVRTLIQRTGIRGRLELSRNAEGWFAEIHSRHSSAILIGRRGSTLRAIQHVAWMIVRRRYPEVPPITLDVGGYRRRRDSFLRRKATAVARIVVDTGREMELETLTEAEMALVRDELRSVPGVRLHAVGTGPRRQVVISPIIR